MSEKIDFDSEYILHKLTEEYLNELFGLELVASEIQKSDKRIDSLAFDEKTNTLVIIEYKNKLDLNVSNQVREYHDLILEKKEEYCERLEDSKNIDFENTRVIIIGPEFSEEQIEESKNLEFPVEFYLISLFKNDDENGCVIYEEVDDKFRKKLDIKLDSIKLTKETLLKNKPTKIAQLYEDFECRLSKRLSDLELKYLVDAVSIKAQNKYICLVKVIKSKIKIIFYTKELEDSQNQTRDISTITTGGPLAYYESTLNQGNIDCAIDLIEQVYKQKVEK